MSERIALFARQITRFGKDTIVMLPSDREFIGDDWFNYLVDNDISFTIRLPHNRIVTRDDGRKPRLSTLITTSRKAHGYLAKSCFGTGFTQLRNRPRAQGPNVIVAWLKLKTTSKTARVV